MKEIAKKTPEELLNDGIDQRLLDLRKGPRNRDLAVDKTGLAVAAMSSSGSKMDESKVKTFLSDRRPNKSATPSGKAKAKPKLKPRPYFPSYNGKGFEKGKGKGRGFSKGQLTVSNGKGIGKSKGRGRSNQGKGKGKPQHGKGLDKTYGKQAGKGHWAKDGLSPLRKGGTGRRERKFQGMLTWCTQKRADMKRRQRIRWFWRNTAGGFFCFPNVARTSHQYIIMTT